MKKLITILIAAAFLVSMSSPMAVAHGRVYFRPHVHYKHYGSGDHLWIGLGLGILTGALISGFYHEPPPPPPPPVIQYEPSRIIYRTPAPAPPRRPPSPPPAVRRQVMVTPAILNLRSGPGMNYEVLGSVNKDDLLDVITKAPGWSYVRAPGGGYGWVMDQYTTPVQPVG